MWDVGMWGCGGVYYTFVYTTVHAHAQLRVEGGGCGCGCGWLFSVCFCICDNIKRAFCACTVHTGQTPRRNETCNIIDHRTCGPGAVGALCHRHRRKPPASSAPCHVPRMLYFSNPVSATQRDQHYKHADMNPNLTIPDTYL